jgi:hypothetical protein
MGIELGRKESDTVDFEPDEYMKRGYLLPEGCKDLIDALKPKPQLGLNAKPIQPFGPLPQSTPLPPIVGEIAIPEHASVLELATLLCQKPFQIVADLMQFGVFANVWQQLDFDTLSKVVRMYGFTAKRAAS